MDFFIADTHFGHANIVKLLHHETKQHRPFDSYIQMDDHMINKWNSVVGPDDFVYHLGDFSLRNADVERTIEWYLSQLNGLKFLVFGNHDRNRTVTYYKKRGFVGASKVPIEYNGLILSHEPVMNSDKFNIHGHTHWPTHLPNRFCVSVEAIDYTPIAFNKIEEYIKISAFLNLIND